MEIFLKTKMNTLHFEANDVEIKITNKSLKYQLIYRAKNEFSNKKR